MATLTAGAGSTNWTSTSFSGGAASTAADEVIVPTGATLTITAANTVLCRSFSVTGTGTIVFAATTSVVTVGDGTAGTGNVALSIAAGGTVTLTGVGQINFVSTSATQQTITTNGKTMPNMNINGAGSSYILGDALTMNTASSTTNLTVTNGTFNTGNFAITGNIWNTATGTKTITLGSSAISLARNGSALSWTTSGLTVTANTAVITFTQSATVSAGGVNFNGASFVFTGAGTKTITGGATVKDLTVTGTATQTEYLTLGANITCTGTFTVTGNSAINRPTVQSDVLGTARTITAATTSLTNVDFMDITGAGAAAWTGTTIGDRQGNSVITFTTPATQTRDSTSGSAWSVAARWTSRVPLPQDDVVINGSSGNISATDVLCLGKSINFSGYTGTLTHTSQGSNYVMFGSLTLGSGMSYGAAVNTFYMEFRGRGSHTITSNGKTLPPFSSNGNYYILAPGGTYTLGDALSFNVVSGVGNCGFNVSNGTFNSAGYSMTIGRFISGGTATRSVTLGSSVVTCYVTAATSILSLTSTGLTWAASSATFTVSQATTNARSFDLQTLTIGTLNYTVANSPGGLTITSSGTINTLNIGTGRLLTITAATTLTVTNTPTLSGTNNGYQYLGGLSGAYISTPDSAPLSITGDITVLARIAMDDWTPSASTSIIAKYGGAGTRSYNFDITTGGLLRLTLSADGTSAASGTSSVATGFTDGTTNWIMASWRASDGRTQFFTAPGSISNPVASDFTRLGSSQTNALGSISNTTSVLELGSNTVGAGNQFIGKFYRAKIYNGVFDEVTPAFGGSVQFDADFTAKTFGTDSFTEGSSNAATVTITGAAAQVGDGRVAIASSTGGTPAYLSKPQGGYLSTDYNVIKDIRALQALNWYVGANTTLVSGNSGIYTTATTYTHKQSAANYTGSTSTSITATFPAATTSGNLLVAYTESANATGGGVTFTAGWTQAVVSTNGGSAYIWYKIADGTETTVTYSQTTARVLTVAIVEYTGFSGTPTLDVTDSNSSGTSVTSLSTTATTGPTNTAQPALALAFAGGTSNLAAWVSATNSYIPDFTAGNTGGGNYIHTVVKELTATAANDTTITWTTSRANVFTGLAVFKNVASAANHNALLLMGVG